MYLWWWQSCTWFKDSASPVFYQVQYFYDIVMFIVFMIGFVVFLCGLFVLLVGQSGQVKFGSQIAEFCWTTIPIFILLFMGYNSLHLLYIIDEVNDCRLSFNILGRQWYWSYEYTDDGVIAFDSYIVEEEDLSFGGYRLAEVDNRVVLPVGYNIRAITLGMDVIHSWALPALGFKLDCIPGRLNQSLLVADRVGVFYGQCSEICGVNHAFMPIVVEFISPEDFMGWVENFNV